MRDKIYFKKYRYDFVRVEIPNTYHFSCISIFYSPTKNEYIRVEEFNSGKKKVIGIVEPVEPGVYDESTGC